MTPPRPAQLLLIANPISGGGRGSQLADELATALRRRGVACEVYRTRSAGDAERRAQQAGDEEHWTGLVAIGGDGTVNEVLNGMPDVTRPLGVLPVGTANVLALELGQPRDVDGVADMLQAARTRRAAIGVSDERRFLLFVGVGIDGAIVQRLAEVRTGKLGKHRWVGPIAHTARHWPRYSLTATLGDGTVLTGLSSVLVTRVRTYGGILRLPGASLASGRLHVLAFRMHGRLAWLWQALRALAGRLRAGRTLSLHDTDRVTITGDAPLQIDGDHGGSAPVSISLLPAAARLYCPASDADDDAAQAPLHGAPTSPEMPR